VDHPRRHRQDHRPIQRARQWTSAVSSCGHFPGGEGESRSGSRCSEHTGEPARKPDVTPQTGRKRKATTEDEPDEEPPASHKRRRGRAPARQQPDELPTRPLSNAPPAQQEVDVGYAYQHDIQEDVPPGSQAEEQQEGFPPRLARAQLSKGMRNSFEADEGAAEGAAEGPRMGEVDFEAQDPMPPTATRGQRIALLQLLKKRNLDLCVAGPHMRDRGRQVRLPDRRREHHGGARTCGKGCAIGTEVR
jgi:hypothetical protein